MAWVLGCKEEEEKGKRKKVEGWCEICTIVGICEKGRNSEVVCMHRAMGWREREEGKQNRGES